MLLFLLHDNFREPPERPLQAPRRRVTVRDEARALLLAGLVLSVWCGVRLLAAYGHGPSVDVALAIPCLCLGLAAMARSARDLRASRRAPRAAEWALR